VDSRLSGQAAIITGSSSGIGRALARALGADRWRVGLIARRRDALEEAAREVEAAGGTAYVAPADIGDREQVRAAVAAIEGLLGPTRLLVANAGVGVPTLVDPGNIEAIEETFRVNVLGVIYAFDAVLPGMLARGNGHLAAVSSLAGDRGLPGESAYCASKAAVNVYLEGLRVQLRGRGIAVSTICPGFVNTPMTAPNAVAMPWVLDADEAAARIVRALRRRAKVYRFPWPTATLMALSRLAPDWLLARLFRDYLENPPMPATSTSSGPASP
jgi:short-subunit dehydrogenase